MFKWKLHYSSYDKHTHVHNHALIYVLRHILFDQDQHNQRRSRAHVCAYNTQTCACIHNPDRKWERERDREKATSRLSITPRHSCTLPHHSIADYSSACAGWLKWSEGYFVPNRQTMRHSPAWLSLWGKDRLAVLFHCSNTTLLPLLILWLAGIYICVCNVISNFCFSTHHPVCFDQWDGVSDELWKDFCASFTFILFLPPKMDFFNLNKAKVIVFCTSSAIFLVPLAAFGGEQLNSRTDRVSNIASK